MNISSHLQKEYWTRRIPLDSKHISPTFNTRYRSKVSSNSKFAVLNMTQDDFLNEIESSAHEINSGYMSTRPIYAPTGRKDANGNEEWAIDHYDSIETVSLGLQSCIANKKTSHFAANGYWISMEEGNQQPFDKLLSWRDRIGLNSAAYIELVNSCFKTGDAAIYLYSKGNKIEYEVFSYLKGDTLYPSLDDEGNPVLYREYRYNGIPSVDIFTTTKIQTWMMLPAESENFVGKLVNIVKMAKGTKSEDGYTLIKETATQTRGTLPVTYFRVPDIPTGPAQMSIEALENALSYVAEEVKSSAFPILFIKSEKIVNLPPSDMNGKTIGVKGTADNLTHADAKYLTPPDASNISSTHINALESNIIKTTMSVFIEPEIFKSGLDSSAALKLLFTPEIQWCQNMWPYFSKGVQQMTENLLTLVGMVEGNISDYANLRVSTGQNIFIPQNEKEQVDMETRQVFARVKSRKAAMSDLGNSHINDYEQIMNEWQEELRIKSEIPAKVKAKYGKDTSSQVDNDINSVSAEDLNLDKNSSGRTIAER